MPGPSSDSGVGASIGMWEQLLHSRSGQQAPTNDRLESEEGVLNPTMLVVPRFPLPPAATDLLDSHDCAIASRRCDACNVILNLTDEIKGRLRVVELTLG